MCNEHTHYYVDLYFKVFLYKKIKLKFNIYIHEKYLGHANIHLHK
jgi:hypothetical protein